jgi:hypothetical protein
MKWDIVKCTRGKDKSDPWTYEVIGETEANLQPEAWANAARLFPQLARSSRMYEIGRLNVKKKTSTTKVPSNPKDSKWFSTSRADRKRPKVEVTLSPEAIAHLEELAKVHGSKSAAIEALLNEDARGLFVRALLVKK